MFLRLVERDPDDRAREDGVQPTRVRTRRGDNHRIGPRILAGGRGRNADRRRQGAGHSRHLGHAGRANVGEKRRGCWTQEPRLARRERSERLRAAPSGDGDSDRAPLRGRRSGGAAARRLCGRGRGRQEKRRQETQPSAHAGRNCRIRSSADLAALQGVGMVERGEGCGKIRRGWGAPNAP